MMDTNPKPMVDPAVRDEELVSRILGGEKDCYEPLIRKYNQRLYRIGLSILGKSDDTEDAMQLTYISAYEHLSSFQWRSSFGTWLTRIMINQCYAARKKSMKMAVELPADDTEKCTNMTNPAKELENKELSQVLDRAINGLEEKYRLVFILREVEALSVKDTATVLGITTPNVKVRLNRAKTMLKHSLQGYMSDHLYHFHLSRCEKMVQNVMRFISPYPTPGLG